MEGGACDDDENRRLITENNYSITENYGEMSRARIRLFGNNNKPENNGKKIHEGDMIGFTLKHTLTHMNETFVFIGTKDDSHQWRQVVPFPRLLP